MATLQAPKECARHPLRVGICGMGLQPVVKIGLSGVESLQVMKIPVEPGRLQQLDLREFGVGTVCRTAHCVIRRIQCIQHVVKENCGHGGKRHVLSNNFISTSKDSLPDELAQFGPFQRCSEGNALLEFGRDANIEFGFN